MSTKSKKRQPQEMTIGKATSNAFVIFLWAFCCEFSPETDMLMRLSRQIKSVRESIVCGALTVPQIRKALKDDYDLSLEVR